MSRVDELAKVIWEYQLMHQKLQKADLILALGSHDIAVGEYASQLFLEGWAPRLMFSGGLGRLTKNWSKPEAEVFADAAERMGVPREAILLETKSTNTAENIRFSKTLLTSKDIEVTRIILIQKPYMERRAYATFRKEWPQMEVIVASPPVSFEEYTPPDRSREEWLNILVGDLQRIQVYAEKGFMIPQEIPEYVWDAYHEMVKLGYTKHVLN